MADELFHLEFGAEVKNQPQDAPKIAWQDAPNRYTKDYVTKIPYFFSQTQLLSVLFQIITSHYFFTEKNDTHVHNNEIWLGLNLEGFN